MTAKPDREKDGIAFTQAALLAHTMNLQERQALFLTVWEEADSEEETCEKVGMSRRTLYRWIQKDMNGFNAKWADMQAYRGLDLESKLYAVLKWATGDEKNYLNLMRHPSLFQMALKAAMPDKYGDKVSLSQDEAHRVFTELAKLRDETDQRPTGGTESVDDTVNRLLGS